MLAVGVQKLSPEPPSGSVLDKPRHIRYWKRCLKTYLPRHYTATDSNRMLLAFFILCALDLLGAMDESMTSDERAGYIEWIYRCQHPDGGFRGCPGTDFGDSGYAGDSCWEPATVPATYLALSSLLMLGDTLEKVKRGECMSWLRKLQRPDGSFGSSLGDGGKIEGGTDSRFGYCACVVRFILRGAVEGVVEGVPDFDTDRLVARIRDSQTYDGGISEAAFHEAHGGFTYCGISALALMRRLPRDVADSGSNASAGPPGLTNMRLTISWLVSRQTGLPDEDAQNLSLPGSIAEGDDTETVSDAGLDNSGLLSNPSANSQCKCAGFNGRVNKPADTCYCFWVGGSLDILHKLQLIDRQACRNYLLDKTQHLVGGFGKTPGDPPDIYHSCLGLAALAVLEDPDLKPIVASTCFSQDTARFLESLPWRNKICGSDGGLPQGFTYSGQTGDEQEIAKVGMSGGIGRPPLCCV